MKTFKQHILEKLKVQIDKNIKIDHRDDDTVGKLYGNDEDKENFQKYLHDCLKRDKYDIQTYNINFIHDRVMFYFSKDQISIILCPFSKDDTYIGLYNRIIDNLKKKQYITEKLKVNSNKNSDPRDYEAVDMLSTNASDKRKFQEYLQDCLKRDKYYIQSYNFEFSNNKVMYYYDKYMRSLCKYSVNDTYIELYDRIIEELRKDNFIHEKLKVRIHHDIKDDHRDYERLGDLSHLATGNNFLYYVYDCLKRDKVKDGGTGFYFGPTKDVISIIYKKFKRNIKYSPDETYIELYNRILDVLREKHFITEKLKVSSKEFKEYKEYKNKTNKVTYYNAYNYHSYILEVDNIDLFMDYWYHFLESEDDALKENLGIHWDDIYLDYDGQDVYVLDNNTGDEITLSYSENPRTFYNVYNRIIEYFEDKTI